MECGRAHGKTRPVTSLSRGDGSVIGHCSVVGDEFGDETVDRRRRDQRQVNRKYDNYIVRLRNIRHAQRFGERRDDCPERALSRIRIDHMPRTRDFSLGPADIHTLDHTGRSQRGELVLQHGAMPDHHRGLVATESRARPADKHRTKHTRQARAWVGGRHVLSRQSAVQLRPRGSH